jgi:DNA replication protein DnaC
LFLNLFSAWVTLAEQPWLTSAERRGQSNIFFKLMEERYARHSTIITTNLEYDEWHNFLGQRPMVEALLSRLRHYCHTLRIKGPSLRDPQG